MAKKSNKTVPKKAKKSNKTVPEKILKAHPNFDKYPDFIKENIIANS